MKPLSTIGKVLMIAIPFIWLGMVAAISFVETPLKFTAPGVTVEIGVGIGRIVFAALNKLEWMLFTLWLLSIFISTDCRVSFINLFVIITILSLQTFWLLPALTARIEMLQKGIQLVESPLHTYFIVAEIIKIGCLFITGFSTITKTINQINQPKTYQI
jgi:hypothetical protein